MSHLLIDIGRAPACCSDHALEVLHKGMAGSDGETGDIWDPHYSPFVRDLIEKFTERGLLRITGVQDELQKWITGAMYRPMRRVPPVPGRVLRWNPHELDLVRLYLSSMPPEKMALSDWSLLVDYLLQRYVPAGTEIDDADWMVKRAGALGRVSAHLTSVGAAAVAGVVEAAKAPPIRSWKISDAEDAILEYGRLRTAGEIVGMTQALAGRIRSLILDNRARWLTGDKSASLGRLEQDLFDAFQTANRDWRRIAVTEAGEMANQGVIASLKPGTRVRRIEMYRGACAFCKRIDGMEFEVVDPATPNKDGWKQVWVGKTNIGRSASPKKRMGDALVDRDGNELWWPAAGLQHPHCRGTWHVMAEVSSGDAAFDKWLDEHFRAAAG